MCEHPVLIVGGGPVGLTLAIDLGQQGIECLLIDKRPEPCRRWSGAILEAWSTFGASASPMR